MKIISFVKSLLPHIGKEQVLEDIRVTAGELDQVVIPNYAQASAYFKTTKMKSDDNDVISKDFYMKFDRGSLSKQSNIVSEIDIRLGNIKENLAYVSSQIEELMERDIINEGLTAKKAVLIRAANHMSFLSRYSTDLLNYLYVNEAIEANVEVEETMNLAPAIIKHVQNNIRMFSTLMSDYGISNKDFLKIYTAIPDVVVSSRTEGAVTGLFKESDIDPFSSPFVQGFSGNPIYHIRLLFAEWQASRYKANKEKKKMLELRLLHLKLLQEKKNDPKIQSEIAYIQNRVDRIERYMREVEESVEMA